MTRASRAGPAPRTALIGRHVEIDAARRALVDDGVRLLTLTGPPGVGKTSLALELAHDVERRQRRRVAVVDLSSFDQPEQLASAVADALRIAVKNGCPHRRLVEYLRDRDMLLVLDNFEQLVPAAEEVAGLLATCARLTVLVTSRVPLRLRGERELPVPPLGHPTRAEPPTAKSAADVPAVKLFAKRARAAAPEFVLTDANVGAVVGVCIRLDGLPLALELAAARMRLLSPAELLERLDAADGRRCCLVTGGACAFAASPESAAPWPGADLPELVLVPLLGRAQLPAYQQTLHAAIASSYAALDEAERLTFRRLAAFAGRFTLDAAERVCAASSDIPPRASLRTVEELLVVLVEHSLVARVPDSGDQPRFRMLGTIREFALEKLRASGEHEALSARTTEEALSRDQEPQLPPPARAVSPEDQPIDPGALTRREREVAALLGRGLTNREIADALVLSERTAANHVHRLMNRVRLHNRARVAAWAVHHGLHSLPIPAGSGERSEPS